MRKIDLDPPATKLWQRWLADCEKATVDVCARFARGEKPAISSLYKRRSVKKSFFFAKGRPFYGKCAYCEASSTASDSSALLGYLSNIWPSAALACS